MIKLFEEYSLDNEVENILNIARDEDLTVNNYDEYDHKDRLMIEIMREEGISIPVFKKAVLEVHRRIIALGLHPKCNIIVYVDEYSIGSDLSLEKTFNDDSSFKYNFTGIELIYHN
jgi:hypothetical protein